MALVSPTFSSPAWTSQNIPRMNWSKLGTETFIRVVSLFFLENYVVHVYAQWYQFYLEYNTQNALGSFRCGIT